MGSSGGLGDALGNPEAAFQEAVKAHGGQAGAEAKPGDPPASASKATPPKADPIKVAGALKSDKGATDQGSAAKKGRDMAEAQVKTGAGVHEKKGGSPKPADPKGAVDAAGSKKVAAAQKGNETAAKADQAKAGEAKQKVAVVKSQGEATPGKEAPGANLGKDGKGAEGAKAAAAAEKEKPAADGAKAPDAGAKDEAKAAKQDPTAAKGEEKGGKEAPKPDDVAKLPGRAPDAGLKSAVEKATGQDLSNVRVHEGKDATAMADAIDAKAFTVGSDVAMGAGADKETEAHELGHAAQNAAAGGSAAPKGSISKPGDPAEKEADQIAGQAMGGDKGGAQAPKAQAPIARLAKGAAVQRAEGTESKEPTKFKLNLGNSTQTISIPSAKKNGSHSQKLPQAPAGLTAATVKLDIANGQVTGGNLSGKIGITGIKAETARFEIAASGTSGSVSGSFDATWSIAKFGTGKVSLTYAAGGLSGSAKLSQAEMTGLPGDCQLQSFEGSLRANGTMNSINATGKGSASFSGGKLKGEVTLKASGESASGTASTDIEIPDFKKAWENGVKNMPAPPKFALKYGEGKWTGDQQVPHGGSAPGVEGTSNVALKYEGGKFSGTGSGSFRIADFISGTIENKISGDGKVEGTFTAATDSFDIGPVKCEGIKLTGGIKNGEMALKASGSLSAFDGKAKGTFSSDIMQSDGMKWHGDVDVQIPHMKSTKIGIDYAVGKGYSGEATVVPEIPGLSGDAKLKFGSDRAWSAAGKFKLDLPLVKGAEIAAQFDSGSGKFTGAAAIDVGSFDIPQCTVKSSSVTASFGEEFSLGGTAEVELAGGKVTGTLSVDYTKGKPMAASVSSQVNIPGLNPIALDLSLQGKSLSGKASTTVNIPYAKQAALEVTYADGKFGGSADVDFDIPFLKAAKGKVQITPEGKVNGSIDITGNDINIAPLTVESPTIKGAINDGKVSLSGGGTVKGIPGCDSARLDVSMGEDQKFSGKIAAQLKIPGLKESKLELELKDGKISGSASAAAEFAGASGAITVKYNDGKWSGKGTLGYKKGKFDGKIEAEISEAGKLSGKGSVAYAITKDFKVTAEITMREDATMVIGGRIQAPSSIELFKKDWKKNLMSFQGRFGIPGLSVQLPVVGVVGLEVQLGGSADVFAGMSAKLTNITVAGSFDTATDDVKLEIGGALQAKGEAGVGINLEAAAGLGIGPAFVGGYLSARGEAKIEAQATAAAKATYSSATQEVALDINLNASAGLQALLSIDAGIKASVDLWVKTWTKKWSFGPLASWKYDTGVKFNYNPQFKYVLGKPLNEKDMEPKDKPKIDGGKLAKSAGSALA